MDNYSQYGSDQRELIVATSWIVQSCSMPGCTAHIRSQAGMQSPMAPVCKWCAGTADSPMHPIHGSPNAMTRGEFGLLLYEAIFLRSQACTARKEANRLRRIGKTAKAEQTNAMVRSLEEQLNKIFDRAEFLPSDIRRILAIGQPDE